MNDLSNTAFVYMFSSPQFFNGLLGHSGLVFEAPSGMMNLYSFHPIKNQGEPFDEGSIAHIINREDAQNFEAFRTACLRESIGKQGQKVRGILLGNGYTEWYERIRRVLKMEVTLRQYTAMEEFAMSVSDNPPKFNVVSYSCQHFVNDTLKRGGIELRGTVFSHRHGIIPNYVYHNASGKSRGVISFEKIVFDSDFS